MEEMKMEQQLKTTNPNAQYFNIARRIMMVSRQLENLLVCRCGDVLCLSRTSSTNFLKTHRVHGGVGTW